MYPNDSNNGFNPNSNAPQPAQVNQPPQPPQPIQPMQPFPAQPTPQQPQSPKGLGFMKKLATKRNIIIASIIIVIAIVAAVVIPMITNQLSNGGTESKNSVATLFKTDSFFVPNKDGSLFALFDGKNEKKLTDYIFRSGTTFVNNTAIVSTANREYGIIKDDGTMLVDFGVHKTISRVGTLYELGSLRDDTHQLINAEGKQVKIPGGGSSWLSSMSGTLATGSSFGTYYQQRDDLYPIVTVFSGEGSAKTESEHVLKYNGEELLSADESESLNEVRSTTGVHTVISGKTKDYIVNNISQKVIGEYADIGVMQSYGDITVFPLEPKGYDKNATKYIIAKGDKITGEFVATGCSYVLVEKMPSDDSTVIRCKLSSAGLGSRLIATDGTTIAEGSIFYNLKTYVAYADKKVTFYKDGNKVKTIDTCRSWARLLSQPYTAVEAYVIESVCGNTLSYGVYNTSGDLIKDGGNEWDLGSTIFDKNGYGIATKKVKRGAIDEGYLVNTSLEVQKGPFGLGKFYESQGKIVYVSNPVSDRNTNNTSSHSAAIYSSDFSTKLVESDKAFAIATGPLDIAAINDVSDVYNPIKARFFKNTGEAYDLVDLESNTTVASGAPTDIARAGLNMYLTHFTIEQDDDNDTVHYFFLSGNRVPTGEQ